jgi:hypothetical protein
MYFGAKEIIFTLLFLVCCFSVAVVLGIIKIFYEKITWKFIGIACILFPFGSFLLLYSGAAVYDFIKKPMTVRKFNIEGDYVINRDFFKGENSDWQYEHYRLKIKNDTLYLSFINNGAVVKTYKRPVTYVSKGKHTFIEFYCINDFRTADTTFVEKIDGSEYYCPVDDTVYVGYETHTKKVQVPDRIFKTRLDSIKKIGNHHALENNPLLHADAFSFNVVCNQRNIKICSSKKENGKASNNNRI